MNKATAKIKYIDDFFEGVIEICNKISHQDIEKLVNMFFQAWLNQNSIFFIGNGGSASNALHFAADINNATSDVVNAPHIRAYSLVENISRYSALVNDRGWNNVYTEQLKNYFRPGDLVVALSVHGGSGKDKAEPWSQNLTAALQYAKDNGGKAIGLAGFDGGAFKDICDLCIVVPYNTTPHVEGFHVVLHHLIFSELKTRIIKASQTFENK